MRQALSTLQKVKTGVHTAQALLIFVAACITITVFTGSGKTGGGSKWYFILCWLSIPALIYLVAVPLWTRAANVAEASWFAFVDVLFALFWFTAFVSVIVWLRKGEAQGAIDHKVDVGNCTIFAYGTEKQCTLSRSAGNLGIVIFLLFAATSGISIFYTYKTKKDPQADEPWLAPTTKGQSYAPTFGGLGNGELEEGKGDSAWDTNMRELDSPNEGDSDDGHGHTPGLPGHRQPHAEDEDEYDSLHNTDEGIHPGRPVHWGPLGSQGGQAGQAARIPDVHVDTEYRGTPSALSPNSYHVDSPAAGHQYSPQDGYGTRPQAGGYSFSQPPQGQGRR